MTHCQLGRAALRVVRALVLCQMRAPYRPGYHSHQLRAPKTAGPGAAAPLASPPPLMRHCTYRRVVFNFRETWKTGNICEIERCLPDKKKQKFPGSPAVVTTRAKIYQGQPPTMYTECSRFHPNRFTYGGVIDERVNTAKTRRKVNPIFC